MNSSKSRFERQSRVRGPIEAILELMNRVNLPIFPRSHERGPIEATSAIAWESDRGANEQSRCEIQPINLWEPSIS